MWLHHEDDLMNTLCFRLILIQDSLWLKSQTWGPKYCFIRTLREYIPQSQYLLTFDAIIITKLCCCNFGELVGKTWQLICRRKVYLCIYCWIFHPEPDLQRNVFKVYYTKLFVVSISCRILGISYIYSRLIRSLHYAFKLKDFSWVISGLTGFSYLKQDDNHYFANGINFLLTIDSD